MYKFVVGCLTERINYQRDSVLGSGSSGNTVYTGAYDGNSCAVKRVLKPSGPGRAIEIENVRREMDIWLKLCDALDNSLPIVRWIGYEEDEDFWYYVAITNS